MSLAVSHQLKALDLILLAAVSQQAKIKNSQSYIHWKTFCTEALHNAKDIISRHDNDRTKEQRGELVTILEKLRWWIEQFGENGITVLVTLLGLGAVAFGAALIATVTTLFGSVFTPWGLAAVVTGGGVFALTISYAKYLYSHKQLVLLALAILENEKIVYKMFQRQKKRSYIDSLFVECVKKLIDELYNKKIMLDDYSLPIHPICVCGNELIGESLQIKVNCSTCAKGITNDSEWYHCDAKTDIHPNGYDMCIACARVYSTRLKRYHAFIIFDSKGYQRDYPKAEFKDGDMLYDLFKNALGYHTIKMLKDDQITKNNIFEYLQQLSTKDDNDVIVICYCGHGDNPGNGSFIFQTTDGNITNDEFLFHLLGNETRTLYNFKTKDVLLMLNACRSGSFEISEVREERKTDDENLKEFVDSLNEFKKNMKKVTKSMFVVSAATDSQDAAPGTVSPFVHFFIEAMKSNKNKDASPKDIYKCISEKSRSDLNFGFLISDIATPNVASQTGNFADAFSLMPIHKMVKIVDNYNKRNGNGVRAAHVTENKNAKESKGSKAKPKPKSKASHATDNKSDGTQDTKDAQSLKVKSKASRIEFESKISDGQSKVNFSHESKCICGNVLQPMNSNECYVGDYPFVICDECEGIIDANTVLYHCDKNYVDNHQNGYDICLNCIKKQMRVFDEILIGDNITLGDHQIIKQNGYNCKHYNAYSKYVLNKDFNHVSFKILSLGTKAIGSIGVGIIPIGLLTNEGGSQKYVGSNELKDSIGYWGYDGEIHKNGCKVVNGNVFGKNDTISFQIDFEANNVQFYKNNVKQGQCIGIDNGIKYKACVTLLRDGQSVQFL